MATKPTRTNSAGLPAIRLLPPYCRRCGTTHAKACKPIPIGGIDWPAVMAYRVKAGHEMTLEEIGEIAGCSRERVRQIEFAALRKLAGRPAVRSAVREALAATSPGF